MKKTDASLIVLMATCLLAGSCGMDNPSRDTQAAGSATAARQKESANDQDTSILGTWKLLTGTLIEKGDTLVTEYTGKLSFIKIISPTHFAFFQHDLKQGRDSAVFSAGSGKYTLSGDQYTEHLEYCNAREWEGHDFTFTIRLRQDTLIQEGVERIEAQGIDRFNREVYVRSK